MLHKNTNKRVKILKLDIKEKPREKEKENKSTLKKQKICNNCHNKVIRF